MCGRLGLSADRYSNLTVFFVRNVFYYLVFNLAGLTVLTHASQFIGITFKLYAHISIAVITIVSALFVKLYLLHVNLKASIKGVITLILVILIGLLGGALSLHSHHPDLDDYYYVPNAVYYLQNPDEKMGFNVHYLYSNGEPLRSYFWNVSGAYEYLSAVVSYFTKLEYLFVFYLLNVALFGFLIPLAIYLVNLYFSESDSSTIFATLVTIGMLLILGETNRTFGIFYFVRIFQGKAILFSIGLPVFAAFSIDFFNKQTILHWFALLSLATAMCGVSSSTIITIIPLSVVLILAYLWSVKKVSMSFLLTSYFSSLVYVLLYAVFVLASKAYNFANVTSPAMRNYPNSFLGHLEFFVNSSFPITPLLMVESTLICIFFMSGLRKKFLVSWIVLAMLLFLNPVIAPLVMKFVTSGITYWRLFYIFPFPLIVGVISSSFYERLSNRSTFIRIWSLSVIGAFLVYLIVSIPTSVFLRSIDLLSQPRYKLPEEQLIQARDVVSNVPAGVMLAPSSISGIIPMLDSRFPQIRVREEEIRTWLYQRDQKEEAELRIKVSDFLGGENGNFEDFRKLIREHGNDIKSIVIRQDVYNDNSELQKFLKDVDYNNQKLVSGYVAVWR